jgi:hypothetical protein
MPIKTFAMRIRFSLLSFTLLLLLVACHKDRSCESCLAAKADSLPANYPFATGYCDGVTLGVGVTDTSYFMADTTKVLPASLQLDMPVPGNQSGQGSCSAWAVIYAAGSYYKHIKTGAPYSDTGNLSAKYTYNQIAKGNCTCASIVDNLYLLKTQGACSLAAMPYDPSECSKQPDSLQKNKAAIYAINDWQKLDLHNVSLVKSALLEKKPVIFAIYVDAGLHTIAPPYIWKNRVTGSVAVPHALVITGYDDTNHVFRVMNSWSTSWGDKGFVWIDYDFFVKNVLGEGYIVI